jgi:peptidoglycan hydrolase FlgJ
MNMNPLQGTGNSLKSGVNSFIPLKSQEPPHIFKINQPQKAIPVSKESSKAIPIDRKGIPINKNTAQSAEAISARKAKLKKSAQGFEAIFIRQLLSSMSSTLPDGGMMGTGMAGDIYGDIINNSLSETMSKKSVLGLADILYNRMVKTIDRENTASSSNEQKSVSQEKAEL